MSSVASSTLAMPTTTAIMESQPTKPVIRKKFAVPPVKVACLDCRASRTRCDGKQDCSNCVNKGKTCVYAQSRRGGSRIRKRAPVTGEASAEGKAVKNESTQQPLPSLPEPTLYDFLSTPISLAAPGAGLKQIDLSFDDTEFIFDSIFSTGDKFDPQDSGYGTSVEPEEMTGPVRVYANDEDILSAYYIYIHPYFPLLPPPPPSLYPLVDRPHVGIRSANDAIFSTPIAPDFEPSTPLSLAISATLALLPHPSDVNSSTIESTLQRREQAQAFASSALESIEIETELLDSVIAPSEALSNGAAPIERRRFHSNVPLEIESILALLMLSSYEYAQRGNIAKMRNRAGQALIKAMDLGLHALSDDGPDVEAERRAWWMTYICVCQGSIFSNTQPALLLYDPRFTTPGPTFASDPEAWQLFLQAQQVIVSATQFVIDLEVALKSPSPAPLTSIWSRMLELEGIIEPLIAAADTWNLANMHPAQFDWTEVPVTQALRGIAKIKLNSARIKLHRYSAFADIPVFTKKHCDLAAVSKDGSEGCRCSGRVHEALDQNSHSSSHSMNGTKPLCNTFSSCTNHGTSSSPVPPLYGVLPFNSQYSAKICLRSAFNIARSFQTLPYPNNNATSMGRSYIPDFKNQMDSTSALDAMDVSFAYQNIGEAMPNGMFIGEENELPRMVPLFACCAMQASYAMVMLSFKSRAADVASNPGLNGSPSLSTTSPLSNSSQSPAYVDNGLGTNGIGNGPDGGAEMSPPVKKMLGKLEEGLGMILDALRNYSIANEALGGMRDQIEVAVKSVNGREQAGLGTAA